MNQKWLFVVNPAAGSGRAYSRWLALTPLLEKFKIEYEVRFTENRGDATKLARVGVETQRFRKIVAVGGDGTGNEVINGIFQQTVVPSSELLYTVLPVGTGNDWVRTLKIPYDLTEFCQMLLRGGEAQQDIGSVEYLFNGELKKHYFANAGGMGYDAMVVKSVDETPQKKRFIPKKISYFGHILKCLAAFKPFKARVFVDGLPVENFWYSIYFGINKYTAAGMQITPHAVSDDGMFALTLIRTLPKWRFFTDLRMFYSGKINEWTFAKTLQFRHLRVEPMDNRPLYLETDGELVSEGAVDIRVLERALRIVSPKFI
ncbi:MAG: hypothetical protein RL757_944 [Bacteroidota bacterium]|jgi:YegS/Rv2252/BmrU family lipid kinase